MVEMIQQPAPSSQKLILLTGYMPIHKTGKQNVQTKQIFMCIVTKNYDTKAPNTGLFFCVPSGVTFVLLFLI